MIRCLSALAALLSLVCCAALPALAQNADGSCNLNDVKDTLTANGSTVLGTEAVQFSDVVMILANHGGTLVVVFTEQGCAEHDATGTILAHRIGAYVPDAGRPEAPAPKPKLQGSGLEINT